MRVGSSHAFLLGADGMTQNDFLSRLWPFKHELLEWAVNFFTPLFVSFFFPRIIYPQNGEMDPDDVNFPWSMYIQLQTWNPFTVVQLLLKQVKKSIFGNPVGE